jgi:hypothetical protein
MRSNPSESSPCFATGEPILILNFPVILDEQIVPCTFEFSLGHLVSSEYDLSALNTKFKNDATGASAYDIRVILEIALLA